MPRPPPDHILFYSKSAEKLPQSLSTFTRVDPPLTYKGRKFESIEHAFQAAKYLFTSPPRPDIADEFAVGGAFGGKHPHHAKREGGKAAMKRRGVVLDVTEWNAHAHDIMVQLVRKRAAVDSFYKSLLKFLAKHKVHLYHFERAGEKSYWGGFFPKGGPQTAASWKGQNTLGRILMAEGARLNAKKRSKKNYK